MTDPITCPECQGACGQRLGALFLACQFCGGLGRVGGAHEPAEPVPPPSGPPPAWEHPIWRDLAGLIPCRFCFGAGRVPHVDRETRTMTTTACPCQTLNAP